MTRWIVRTSLVAAALGGAGCAEGDASAGSAVVRDSAGVSIVESTEPRWVRGEDLALSAAPLVTIGELDAPGPYQLHRVAGATRFGDGRIAIFDGGSSELRFFDADGEFVARVGGEGEGPGEYRFVSWMARLPGDSLLLHDTMAQRLTLLAPGGAVARSVSLAAAAPPAPRPSAQGGGRASTVSMMLGRYRVLGPFSDGTLLARASDSFGEPGSAVHRDSVVYVRLNDDGTLRDTLGVFLGDERQVSHGGSGENRFMMSGPPPFGRTAQVAIDGDGFYYGSTDAYDVRRYAGDGVLQRSVRRAVTPLAVTEADVAERKRVELERTMGFGGAANAAQLKQAIAQKWETAVIPETMPAHGELRVDAAGRLWVRETARPADLQPRWTVFDAEGRMLGTVVMPERFRVLEIGRDYVLGVQPDEFDVEQVQLYALAPASPEG